MGALGTELGSRGELRPAVGARPRHGCRALLAELRAGVIIVLAPGTLHPDPSRRCEDTAVDSAPRLVGGRTLARPTGRVNTDDPMRKPSTRGRRARRRPPLRRLQ